MATEIGSCIFIGLQRVSVPFHFRHLRLIEIENVGEFIGFLLSRRGSGERRQRIAKLAKKVSVSMAGHTIACMCVSEIESDGGFSPSSSAPRVRRQLLFQFFSPG